MANWFSRLKPRTKVIGAVVGVLAIAGIGVASYFAYNRISASTTTQKQLYVMGINNWDFAGQKYFHDTFGQDELFRCSTVNLYLTNPSAETATAFVAVAKANGLTVGAANLTDTINKIKATYGLRPQENFRNDYEKKNAAAILSRVAILSSSEDRGDCNRGEGAGKIASIDYSPPLTVIPTQYQQTAATGGTQPTSGSGITNQYTCVKISDTVKTTYALQSGDQWKKKNSNDQGDEPLSRSGNNFYFAAFGKANYRTYKLDKEGECSGTTGSGQGTTSTISNLICAKSLFQDNTYTWIDKTLLGADYTQEPDEKKCGIKPTGSAVAVSNLICARSLFQDNTYLWIDETLLGADYVQEPIESKCGSKPTTTTGAPQATNNQMTLNVSAVYQGLDSTKKFLRENPVLQAEVVVLLTDTSGKDSSKNQTMTSVTDSQGKTTLTLKQSDLRQDTNGKSITKLQIYASKDLRVLNKDAKKSNLQSFDWVSGKTQDIKLVFPDLTAEEAAATATYAAQPLGGSGGNLLVPTTLDGSNFPKGDSGFKVALAVPSQVEEGGFTMAGGGTISVQGCFTNATINAQQASKSNPSIAYAVGPFEITGTVKDKNGTLIKGATIIARVFKGSNPTESPIIGNSVLTDQNGKFKISVSQTYEFTDLIIQASSNNLTATQIVLNASRRDIGDLVLSGSSSQTGDATPPQTGSGTAAGFVFTPPYSSVIQPFYREGETAYNQAKQAGGFSRCGYNFTIKIPDNGKNSAVIVNNIAEGIYRFNASKGGSEATSWWAQIKGSDNDLKMLPIIPSAIPGNPPSISANNVERKAQYRLGVYKAPNISKCTDKGLDAFFIAEYPWYGWQCAKGDENKGTVEGYVITEPSFTLSSGLYGMPAIPPNRFPQTLGAPTDPAQRAAQCASSMSSTSVGFGGVNGDILLALGAGYLTGTTVYDSQRSAGSTVDNARTNGWLSGALAAYSVYKGGNVNISRTQIQQCFGSLQPQVYDPGAYCRYGSTDPYCQIYALNPSLANRYMMNSNPRLWLGL